MIGTGIAWPDSRILVAALAVAVGLPIPTSGAHGSEEIPTLEDIVIEGEIPVPEVLFITARDQRRYDDYLYAAYLRSSLELCRETVLPMWIGLAPAPVLIRAPVEDAGDEIESSSSDETHSDDGQ